jgi:hypothetical protein
MGDVMTKRHFELTWIVPLVSSLWLVNAYGLAGERVVSKGGAQGQKHVDVAYARAALKVAELELQQILDTTKWHP